MGRSRSRSRSRERSKHKHHKHHKKTRKHSRSRSRSPIKSPQISRIRSRSRSPRQRSRSPKYRKLSPPSSKSDTTATTLGGKRLDYLTLGNVKPKISAQLPVVPILDPSTLEGKTQDEIEMMKLLGFSSFDTTKGKHVDGSCNASASNIQQKRRYRQYMNRKGGFNRPLDPVV